MKKQPCLTTYLTVAAEQPYTAVVSTLQWVAAAAVVAAASFVAENQNHFSDEQPIHIFFSLLRISSMSAFYVTAKTLQIHTFGRNMLFTEFCQFSELVNCKLLNEHSFSTGYQASPL